jgi:hypothetical protein
LCIFGREKKLAPTRGTVIASPPIRHGRRNRDEGKAAGPSERSGINRAGRSMELLPERAEHRTAPAAILTDPETIFWSKHGRPLCGDRAAIALLLKIIAFNTFGTNDVVSFYQFALSLHYHGLETYGNDIAFNHPPLVAHFWSDLKLAQLLRSREWHHVCSCCASLASSPTLWSCALSLP